MRKSAKGTAIATCAALVAAMIATVVAMLHATSATAATYPPTTCATISVSTTTPHVGEAIAVTGANFKPNVTVTLKLTPADEIVGTPRTDADGKFSTTITMPADSEGNQLLSAVGEPKVCPADPIHLVVSGNGGSSSSGGGGGGQPPAMTGLDVALLIGIALALLGAGVLFTRGGKHRRRAPSRS